jgi:hypothetical protein
MNDRDGNTIAVGDRVELLDGPGDDAELNVGKSGEIFEINPSAKDSVLVADAWPKWRWASWTVPTNVRVLKLVAPEHLPEPSPTGPVIPERSIDALMLDAESLPDNAGTTSIPTSDLKDMIGYLRRLTDLNIKSMEYRSAEEADIMGKKSGVHIEAKVPKWFHAILISHLGKMLVNDKGEPAMNYVSQSAWHHEFGDVEVVIQRKNRKTPLMMLQEAEWHLRQVLSDVDRGSDDKTAKDFLNRSAQAFLDRPRTESPPHGLI